MDHLGIAIETAKKVGAFLIKNLNAVSEKRSKGKNDWVTNVDIEAEEMIKNNLQNNFPEYGFQGEESTAVEKTSEYRWVVDPIDGTDNYIHQLPHFTTTIALLKNDQPILGVIYEPLAGNLFYAEQYKGAFLNDTQIHTSRVDSLPEALIFFIPGTREGDDMNAGIPLFQKVLNIRTSVKSWGSVALEIACVAAGNAEAGIYNYIDPYSMPAAKIILEEAGGMMCDIQGRSWDQKCTTTFVSNGVLHKEFLSLFK